MLRPGSSSRLIHSFARTMASSSGSPGGIVRASSTSPSSGVRARQLEVASQLDTLLPALGGADTDGKTYPTISALWKAKARDNWYSEGRDYWAAVSTDVDGVLGGQSHVSSGDLSASGRFLDRVMPKHGVGNKRCIDCGAGIGRITRGLLVDYFDTVDIQEQSPDMVRSAVEALRAMEGKGGKGKGGAGAGAGSGAAAPKGRLGEAYTCGLQDFYFPSGVSYDIVWFQWVVGCVTDADFIRLLRDGASSLSPEGAVVVKDNVCRAGQGFFYDTEDSSIARGREYFSAVFSLAGLEVVEMSEMGKEKGDEWDDELMSVFTWMLRPAAEASAPSKGAKKDAAGAGAGAGADSDRPSKRSRSASGSGAPA
jgi:protein N-terminal methyltransferase